MLNRDYLYQTSNIPPHQNEYNLEVMTSHTSISSYTTTQFNTPLQAVAKNHTKTNFASRNNGHWTEEEHETYVMFLKSHSNENVQKQKNKKNNKMFKLMAESIGTRSPSQCRSHHQKFNPSSPQGQKRGLTGRRRILNKQKEKISRRLQFDEPKVLVSPPQEQVDSHQEQIKIVQKQIQYVYMAPEALFEDLPPQEFEFAYTQPPQLISLGFTSPSPSYREEFNQDFRDSLFQPIEFQYSNDFNLNGW